MTLRHESIPAMHPGEMLREDVLPALNKPKSEIAAADDPEAELEAIKERLSKVTSPFRSAGLFNVEDIIDPRDTRPLLCEIADLAWRRLKAEG